MRVSIVASDDPDLMRLLELALAELVAKYGPGRSVVRDDATYLLARIGNEPAGCVAVQSVDGRTDELKRMYVAPAARGKRVARTMLAAVEELAAKRGKSVLRMATGVKQPEAIALYTSAGFERVEPWGRYVGDDGALCFAKHVRAR
jgi:GNAT superfamily N-acetyltransferase